MDDEARQRAGWTKEMPQEMGVYWWRSNALDNHPWPVRVHKGDMGLMLMQTIGGAEPIIIGDGGEWRGPITPDDGDREYQRGLEVAAIAIEGRFENGATADMLKTGIQLGLRDALVAVKLLAQEARR